MSVHPTETATRIPPRKYPPSARRSEWPTIEHVEAALAEAPHLRLGRRPPHTEKFVSRASEGTSRPEGVTKHGWPITWKDAAAFGEAQMSPRKGGYLERRRNEAVRFGILAAVGTLVTAACVVLAILK